MGHIKIKFFSFFIIILSFNYTCYTPILQSMELDLAAAQEAVGKRFATKFCEAKKEDFLLYEASEFALNNTYLKFVSFPDDQYFIENLWNFTLGRIRKDCGEYLTHEEVNYLRNF